MGANFSEFNGVVLSVVGDVPMDNETPMCVILEKKKCEVFYTPRADGTYAIFFVVKAET